MGAAGASPGRLGCMDKSPWLGDNASGSAASIDVRRNHHRWMNTTPQSEPDSGGCSASFTLQDDIGWGLEGSWTLVSGGHATLSTLAMQVPTLAQADSSRVVYTMKVTYALAVAATIEQASATFPIGGDLFNVWKDVESFICPGKTPTICKPDQVPGYDWGKVPVGPVDNYGGCNFKGWTCKKKFGRRDMLAGRQDDGSKFIEADVATDGSSQPVIEASNEIGSFDINNLSVEVDTPGRYDFIYTVRNSNVPCKQTHELSTEGQTIVNTQCGDATALTIALAKNQGNQKRTLGLLLKKFCKIKCHKIDFWCKPPPPGQTTTPPATPPGIETTPPATPPATESTPPATPPGTETTPPATPPGTETTPPATPPGTETTPPATPPGTETTPPATPPGTETTA
ncbi:hypothetical protein MY10362_009711, partial [Beauveria mimosiformis]